MEKEFGGLAIWQVLFVLPRIDWTKGIGQVLASVDKDVQVGTRRMVGMRNEGVEDTSRTPVYSNCACAWKHFMLG